MSIDTHIKFEGVEGESQHADHKGEIQILSWSWNVTNHSNTAGGGSGVGGANAGELSLSKQYDKASPVLAKKCAQGVHFPTAVLTARKAGEGQKDFLKITLKEVFITSVNPGGGGGGEVLENVSMSYGSIEFAYKAQDAKGGMGGEVKFAWDVKSTKIT